MLNIIFKSIVDDEIINNSDAIVNATNPYMIMGSSVCGAILKKAGVEELENYTRNTYKEYMKVKEIRITPGFKIKSDIIFAQGPKKIDYNNENEAINDLLMTYRNILDISIEKEYKTISLVALGTGIYGFTHEETAEKVLKILKEYEDRININLCLASLKLELYYKDMYDKIK